MKAKKNKYRYLKIIQGSFGYGWEDLAEYDNYELQQLKADLKEYRASGIGSYRVIERRELNNKKND